MAIALCPEDQMISIREISERTQISDNYLEQIFTLLKKGDIIASTRGASGGYRLARPASRIFVGDVLRAAEKSLSPVLCIEDMSACTKSTQCAARNAWSRLDRAISDSVNQISISDLVNDFHNESVSAASDYTI